MVRRSLTALPSGAVSLSSVRLSAGVVLICFGSFDRSISFSALASWSDRASFDSVIKAMRCRRACRTKPRRST
jgi:hypothetical protein